MVLRNANVVARGQSKELVVMVHGWRSSSAKLADPRKTVEEELPDADLLVPDYPASTLSSADCLLVTQELVDAIEAARVVRAKSGRPYERIILIGHSLGALLVRKAFVWASGENQDFPGPLRPARKEWPQLVERIILLAGTNRGWKISWRPMHMNVSTWLLFTIIAKIHRWSRLAPLINCARRGAPFLVNLQIQWINLIRKRRYLPSTIQLLGGLDDIVHQEDNVDIQSGAGFVYKHVPDTGHVNVIEFDGAVGAKRKAIFVEALRTKASALSSDFIAPLKQDWSVSRVVFVMHGIRDFGHWTKDIASRVEDIGRSRGESVKAFGSGYGYFPILGFIVQPERQKNVRWFMDEYTRKLVEYPNADMSFIGHSNGTYLLASALLRYRASAFDYVVFAGSVVPREFPWDPIIKDEERVKAIKNYVATNDWVVALCPAVFEHFKRPDLGSGGHAGFTNAEGHRYEVRFMKGRHGAALVAENHDAMATFALGVDSAKPPSDLVAPKQNNWTAFLSKLSPLLWAIVLGLVSAGFLIPLIWSHDPWWWLFAGGVILYLVLCLI